MQIECGDDEVERATDQPGGPPPGWTLAEVARVRLLVQCLHAAQSPDDVLSLRSLRLKPDPDDGERATAELSSGRALAVTFKSGGDPMSAILGTVTPGMDSEE